MVRLLFAGLAGVLPFTLGALLQPRGAAPYPGPVPAPYPAVPPYPPPGYVPPPGDVPPGYPPPGSKGSKGSKGSPPKGMPKPTTHDNTFVPDAVLVFTVKNMTQASCVPEKPTVLINGTSPGPEIRLKEGQTYWIRVYNNIPDQNVTVHWHGLSMAVSPWSDGTPQAAQWPMAPNTFFDYEINLPMGLAGTYFYHSHVGFQAVSATGPLIVEDAKTPPYKYDDERIIFLTDTFPKSDETIIHGLEANPFQWSGETGMILINGKGGGTQNITANDTCNSPLSVINVAPGKTYRIRFIGGTALTFAYIKIQGHENLTVIEADGAYTMPQDTDHLQIASGQRFSILMKMKEGMGPKDFMIQVESRDRPCLTRSFAVLNYGSGMKTGTVPKTPPLTLGPTDRDWLEYQLKPLSDNHFPQLTEVTRRVTIDVHQLAKNGSITWNENGFPWYEETPKEPYLVSLLKNDGVEFPDFQRAIQNGGIDPVTRAFPAMMDEVLEIVLQNSGATSGMIDFHPFHAHGTHYWDIGSGNGTYDIQANEERLKGTQPVVRDTTLLFRYAEKTTPNVTMGWRAWRIRVNEPGVWMIHCHILQHMVMGMQTAWVMGNYSELMAKVKAPDVSGYLEFGGNATGKDGHFPETVSFQDNWLDSQ